MTPSLNITLTFQSIFIVIYSLYFACGVEYYKEKPEYIKTCKLYHPGYIKCLTESINDLFHHISTYGIPELEEKFGPIDPFKLDKVSLKGDNNQAVTISANLTDILIKGFSATSIKENKVNRKDFSSETKVKIPKVHLNGKYKMLGRILVIPLNGAGDISLEIDDIDIISHVKANLYEKDGLTFYNVTGVKVDLNAGNMLIYLSNLFGGKSKDIEESTNQFLNDNWQAAFEALRPLIVDTIENILIKILKGIFELFPLKFFIEDAPTSTEFYNKNS